MPWSDASWCGTKQEQKVFSWHKPRGLCPRSPWLEYNKRKLPFCWHEPAVCFPPVNLDRNTELPAPEVLPPQYPSPVPAPSLPLGSARQAQGSLSQVSYTHQKPESTFLQPGCHQILDFAKSSSRQSLKEFGGGNEKEKTTHAQTGE